MLHVNIGDLVKYKDNLYDEVYEDRRVGIVIQEFKYTSLLVKVAWLERGKMKERLAPVESLVLLSKRGQ